MNRCTEPGCHVELISSAHETAHKRAAHPLKYAAAVCPIHPYCLGDCSTQCLLDRAAGLTGDLLLTYNAHRHLFDAAGHRRI